MNTSNGHETDSGSESGYEKGNGNTKTPQKSYPHEGGPKDDRKCKWSFTIHKKNENDNIQKLKRNLRKEFSTLVKYKVVKNALFNCEIGEETNKEHINGRIEFHKKKRFQKY